MSADLRDVLGTRSVAEIPRRSRARLAFIVVAVLAIAGYALGSAAWSRVGGTGAVDRAYDVSDPELVFGQAAFVVVGRVNRKLGRTPFLGDRMAFEVVVQESLKGSTPRVVTVSQLGSPFGAFFTGFDEWPLMRQGETFVMALTPPGPGEEALILLSGPGGGNLLPVDGRSGSGVAAARAALRDARYPPAIADQRPEDVRRVERFTSANEGFSSPGPAALP